MRFSCMASTLSEPHSRRSDAAQRLVLTPLRSLACHLRELGGRARELTGALFVRVGPALLTALASGAAYGGGLAAFQLLAYQLRISCASRVWAPTLGMLATGAASAASGAAARAVRAGLASHAHRVRADIEGDAASSRRARGRVHPRQLLAPLAFKWDAQELLLDALTGMFALKALGGSFARAMPSDLRHPGAFACGSVPAAGAGYASEAQRLQLGQMMRRDGCHSCGTRSGPIIGDHQPPNKTIKLLRAQQSAGGAARADGAGLPPPLQQLGEWLGGIAAWGARGVGGAPPALLPRQAYYPQCVGCSRRQGALMSGEGRQLHARAGQCALVMHLERQPPPGLLPGVIVGAVQSYCAAHADGRAHGAPLRVRALAVAVRAGSSLAATPSAGCTPLCSRGGARPSLAATPLTGCMSPCAHSSTGPSVAATPLTGWTPPCARGGAGPPPLSPLLLASRGQAHCQEGAHSPGASGTPSSPLWVAQRQAHFQEGAHSPGAAGTPSSPMLAAQGPAHFQGRSGACTPTRAGGPASLWAWATPLKAWPTGEVEVYEDAYGECGCGPGWEDSDGEWRDCLPDVGPGARPDVGAGEAHSPKPSPRDPAADVSSVGGKTLTGAVVAARGARGTPRQLLLHEPLQLSPRRVAALG
ncbi:hypothetical protein FOA52_005479 [Chlamydomonas sp. UWO 241]|nr:hypothetical protein FOA52_005479 [Chlamydomonas sp. UWO 241]